MLENVVQVILLFVALYLVAGFVFALFFAFKWVNSFDEATKDSPLLFRLLIIPASTLLWIYLLKKIRERK